MDCTVEVVVVVVSVVVLLLPLPILTKTSSQRHPAQCFGSHLHSLLLHREGQSVGAKFIIYTQNTSAPSISKNNTGGVFYWSVVVMAGVMSQRLLSSILPRGGILWGCKGSPISAGAATIHTSGNKLAANRKEAEASSLPSEAVFYHPKHDMYVCWHPEVPFPYEMSKPIPTEAPGTESVLKVQSLIPVKEVFRKKNERVILRELVRLTYTPKYGFMGKYGKKKRDVFRDMDPLKQRRDREYL